MLVYLDGKYLPKEDAKISVDDRGFVFGDGIYEVTRAINGELFEEEGHWKRLEYGLRNTAIPAEGIDRGFIREISQHLLQENGLTGGDATVYLQITRGAAPRAHAYPANVRPTIYASASSFTTPTDLRTRGASAITVQDVRWSRCDVKTIQLLPNAMAKQKAVEAGCFEALFVRDGVLLEGASTNAFGVIDGELRTYPKSNYILPGITRDVVLELARELGIRYSETPIFVEDLGRLQELFVTGTMTDVQAIIELDGRRVGDGVPGRIAKALREALVERMGGVAVATG